MPTIQKFKTEDQTYFEERNRFAEKYGWEALWSIADHWPLFAGLANISRRLAIYELVKKVIDLPGHFCELGCWQGTNLVYLAKLIDLLRPQGYVEVIGFDSFEGLQNFDHQKDSSPLGWEGRYKGNPELLEDVLRLYKLEDGVQLVKGRIEDTLPRFLEERKDIRFSFIYLDVDLYSPTKLGIELLYPRLLKGGIMVFDQYNVAHWTGETSSVHELLGDDVQIHGVPFTRQPTAYIIK